MSTRSDSRAHSGSLPLAAPDSSPPLVQYTRINNMGRHVATEGGHTPSGLSLAYLIIQINKVH